MDSKLRAARRHWYGALVACMVCLIAGTSLALIIGRSQTEFWIVFGGNTDPGDGHGGGMARGQFVGGGWVSNDNIVQITWKADIAGGGANQVADAMPAGHAAVDEFCRAYDCVIAGFSFGTAPAIQLGDETGLPVKLFGAPQPKPGIYHNPYADNPFIKPWIEAFGFGPLRPDRVVRPGTENYYDTMDIYADGGPSCGGPGLFLLNAGANHRIVSKAEADGSHVWTSDDGVINHEVGYQAAPFGLPRSGSDPSQPWDFCPPSAPSVPIPAMNGDPGVPQLPGVPTR